MAKLIQLKWRRRTQIPPPQAPMAPIANEEASLNVEIDLGPVEVQGNFVVFLDFTRHALASSEGCDRTACQYKSRKNVKISFTNRAFRFKR